MTLSWLGLVEYREALSRQREHRDAVIAGDAPEAIWFVEHPPVVTVGRRAAGVDEAAVRAAGFDLVATERGGLATCHEPGQLLAYLLVRPRRGIRRLVRDVETAVAATCAELGVRAARREGTAGLWAPGGKLCSIGLHVRRGVAMHGLALNLVNDRRGFGLIAPCGEPGAPVTSVLAEVGQSPTPRQAWRRLGRHLRSALLADGADVDHRFAVDDCRAGE